ncbi:MAG: 2-amino-4-hydroxy-6-hydroxymethyldihydropteridine pyrophosphokinae [Labilithrix sp.]|nr:2-amino-4-hydroxy-6-hydroxymethyldihydropteridine pyrophosphokinae [Labilithrix sp.]
MRAAAARISELANVRVRARSRVYESAPVGVTDQPWFLNAAVLADCMLLPATLLGELLRIERELGRDRTADAVRWGPRLIDLDVLWIEGLAVDTERLTVPHPRLKERAFAILPLLDVAPDALDPATGEGYVPPRGSRDVRLTGLSLG